MGMQAETATKFDRFLPKINSISKKRTLYYTEYATQIKAKRTRLQMRFAPFSKMGGLHKISFRPSDDFREHDVKINILLYSYTAK